MQHNDDKLVQLTLEGDHHAFAALVEKYQSQIHALAWRKTDDFHIAEDITQEVFLTAYQKLNTLTRPDRFASWLYAIVNNLCVTWLRKRSAQPQQQSITSTDPAELSALCFSDYITQQHEDAERESHRALIQNLLGKLRESDRTVIYLYYLAELNYEEISKLLRVPLSTIKSRLHRARKRLKKHAAAIEHSSNSFRLSSEWSYSNETVGISRRNKMLIDILDVHGHMFSDYHNGQEDVEVVEREDGLIDTSSESNGLGPRDYFAEYEDWAEHQKCAIEHVRGRVLDVGCAAGRHALYLQEQGHDVLGVDNSSLAIETCQRRGLKNTRVMPTARLSSGTGIFDTILLIGRNFGFVGSSINARSLLNRFAAMTSDTGKIIFETLDPYQTADPRHLSYHQFNQDHGRMGGQLRLRVHYREYTSQWFDYLFVSKAEIEDILSGTAWQVEDYIDLANTPTYVAILSKRLPA
jgi:RNA polymerase sigma factor (sigma-70 family)